ncbi:MAG: hypothetical protein RL733_1406 [Actinomycetota bacterium]
MSEGKCSRANCKNAATHLIDWANPMIHCGDRKKTWAACEEHKEYLIEFVKARNFFIATRQVLVSGN